MRTRPLYIYGAGGHGKVVAEAARFSPAYELRGFLDDERERWGQEWNGLPVLGGEDRAGVARGRGGGGPRHRRQHDARRGGRDDPRTGLPPGHGRPSHRRGRARREPRGGNLRRPPRRRFTATPRWDAAASSTPEPSWSTTVGSATGSTSRRARLSGGGVAIGEGAHVALGAIVLPGLALGPWATLGAGAVMVHSLPDYAKAMGVPARSEGPEKEARMTPLPRIHLSPPHLGDDERTLVQDVFASNWIAPLGPHVDAFEREFAAAVGARPRRRALLGNRGPAPGLAPPRRGPAATRSSARPSPSWPPPTPSSTRAPFPCSSTPTPGPGTWTRPCSPRSSRRPRAAAGCPEPWSSCTSTARAPTSTPSSRPASATACRCSRTRPRPWARATRAAPRARAGPSASSRSTATRSSPPRAAACSSPRTPPRSSRSAFLASQAREPAPHYEHATVGFNYRLSNVLAAIGRGQLHVLADRVAARRRTFAYYVRGAGRRARPVLHARGRLRRVLALAERDADRRPGVRRHRRGRPAPPRALQHRVAPRLEAHAPAAPLSGLPEGGRPRGRRPLPRGLCLPSGSALTDAERDRVVAAVIATPRKRRSTERDAHRLSGAAATGGAMSALGTALRALPVLASRERPSAPTRPSRIGGRRSFRPAPGRCP